jgi:hypothetical protein
MEWGLHIVMPSVRPANKRCKGVDIGSALDDGPGAYLFQAGPRGLDLQTSGAGRIASAVATTWPH